MGDLEEAVSSGTLGVNNSFRDSLSIEVGQLIDEVEIGNDDGAVRTCRHRVLVVVNRLTC